MDEAFFVLEILRVKPPAKLCLKKIARALVFRIHI
jgi:hypothetical protein